MLIIILKSILTLQINKKSLRKKKEIQFSFTDTLVLKISEVEQQISETLWELSNFKISGATKNYPMKQSDLKFQML